MIDAMDVPGLRAAIQKHTRQKTAWKDVSAQFPQYTVSQLRCWHRRSRTDLPPPAPPTPTPTPPMPTTPPPLPAVWPSVNDRGQISYDFIELTDRGYTVCWDLPMFEPNKE